MPYTYIPGLPDRRYWQPVPPEAGRPAMLDSLRECLAWTATAAEAMRDTATALQQQPDQPEPPPAFTEAVAGLDEAVSRAIRQWREIIRGETVCYDTPDAELPRHPSLDAAVNAALETCPDFDYPETVSIAHYVHMPVQESPTVSPLRDLIDRLDEEHSSGSDQGGLDRPSEELKTAERRFIESALLEYRGWWLEIAAVTRVNVRRWLSRHRPDLYRMRNHTTSICGHCRAVAGAETMRTCALCGQRGCARCWKDIEPRNLKWQIRQQRLARGETPR